MAEDHTIETYGRGPYNRNIWSHTIARRRHFVTPGRFFCLSWCAPSIHYSCNRLIGSKDIYKQLKDVVIGEK